ncbi:MAG: hypothetical protein ACO24W_01635 [Candidatus Nanopelagicales bacterium]
MTRLQTLQRKTRIQRWKYVIAAVLIALAGIGVTLSNPSHSMPAVTQLIEDSAVPLSSTPASQTPGIDYFSVILALDELRNEAFRSRNFDALLMVSAQNSPQLLRDQKILKRIIEENLAVEFALVTLISVEPISTSSSDEVLLKVRDQRENQERSWNVKLIRQSDGRWRFFEVTSVPLSVQIENLDE